MARAYRPCARSQWTLVARSAYSYLSNTESTWMLSCSGDSMTHLHTSNGEVGSIPARHINREATTRTEPKPAGREGAALRELKLTCMNNLLSASEERVYFKDLRSRFLLVSKGWTAAYAPGRPVEELIGKTDFDVFDEQHASVAFADEQQII